MKYTFISFIILLFLGNSSVTPVRQKICQLVENHVTMDLSLPENRYDNGYTEQRYHFVLDSIIAVFGPLIQERGGRLRIKRDWTDGAVNAWAERWGELYILEIPGGMARYHLINEEGFLTTICHELGHLLGGSPHRRTISVEGQADYYSTMKCMELILAELDYPHDHENLSECHGDYCQARLSGALSLSSYYAELARRPVPRLDTPDLSTVSRTRVDHPPAQCRFDTMVAGIKCANRDDFSYENAREGACLDPVGARPSCWFHTRDL